MMLRDTSPLDDAFASPEIKRRYNRRMFGTIAPRYDFFTRFAGTVGGLMAIHTAKKL